jgi:F-type H+-transporting ATPase subunit a
MQGGGEAVRNPQDIITPHIRDAHSIDYPCAHTGFVCEYHLPQWAPVHIGGLTIDLSPTKHVVMLLVAAICCCLVLIPATAYHRRHPDTTGNARGFGAGIEALVLYLRNEVVLPNVGPHGDAYVPFVLSLFFFILFANLLGMVPYGSAATGNISVTAALALVSFLVIEYSGMRALGAGYWKTIVYWNTDLPIAVRIPMAILMTPLEIIAKLTKPFALTVRLFANMTAGHVVLLALISLIFIFRSWLIAPAPFAMAIAISILELFVALLQAFIFSLLTAVFIGQIREAAH